MESFFCEIDRVRPVCLEVSQIMLKFKEAKYLDGVSIDATSNVTEKIAPILYRTLQYRHYKIEYVKREVRSSEQSLFGIPATSCAYTVQDLADVVYSGKCPT